MVSATATETLQLLAAYNDSKDSGARDKLVINYLPLVRRLCNRFSHSREPREDLIQTGVIGLLRTVDKFDSARGVSFSSLAIPEVLGVIMNHFRDHDSLIKVPRDLRQRKLAVNRASESLAVRLSRWPTKTELADECGLSVDELNSTFSLARMENLRSLDQDLAAEEADGNVTLSDFVGCEDESFELSLDRMTLTVALDSLPPREKTIITLRFFEAMSQRQVAERLGISQMHVSRLERASLLKLRKLVQGEETPVGSASHEPQPDTSHLPAA